MLANEINHRINVVRTNDGRIDEICDWTGSEDASAVLLEEMPLPDVFRDAGGWCCRCDMGQWSFNHADRKVAIALAWLKWKGLDA